MNKKLQIAISISTPNQFTNHNLHDVLWSKIFLNPSLTQAIKGIENSPCDYGSDDSARVWLQLPKTDPAQCYGSWLKWLSQLKTAPDPRFFHLPWLIKLWTVHIHQALARFWWKQFINKDYEAWIHEEWSKMMKNWWSFDQKMLDEVLRIWEKMEGKVVTDLGECEVINNFCYA